MFEVPSSAPMKMIITSDQLNMKAKVNFPEPGAIFSASSAVPNAAAVPRVRNKVASIARAA